MKEYRGISNLVYAKVTKDDGTDLTFGTVAPLSGVAEMTKEVETSSATHYYDNQPMIIIDSTGKDTVTLKVSAIEPSVLAAITGQFYDSTKGVLVEGPRTNDYFAIGYKTKKTDGTEVFVWRLKGTFAIPKESVKTEDDGTDAEGQELVYTGINTQKKFTLNGNSAKGVVIETLTKAGSKFFDEVRTPDSTFPCNT